MKKIKVVAKGETFEEKGYNFLGIAHHSETLEELDVYMSDLPEEKGKLKEGQYKHFKGGKYNLLGIDYNETFGDLVLYQALYNSEEFGENALWLRPKNLFFGTRIINGAVIKNFEYIIG